MVRLIDGKSTAAEISSEAPADAFAVEKLLAALVTLGLVHPEFVAADTTPRPSPLPVRERDAEEDEEKEDGEEDVEGEEQEEEEEDRFEREDGDAQEEGEETLVARPGEPGAGPRPERRRKTWPRSRNAPPSARPSPTPKRLPKRGAPPRVSGSRSSKSSGCRAPGTEARSIRVAATSTKQI